MVAVELSGLSHAYGRGAMRRQVLQNISLRIDPGEVVLLTGPSGCGKTTTLKMINRLNLLHQTMTTTSMQTTFEYLFMPMFWLLPT